MRKWSLILFCFTSLSALAIILFGCEGDTGTVGGGGLKGRTGPNGRDVEHGIPANRYFGVAVANASRDAVDGKKRIYLSFDSTAKATKDTVVANRVTVPPLIDGFDGEETEWGEQKSRLRLNYLNPDPSSIDPQIYDLACRVAYDDDFIYMFYQWKEVKFSVKVPKPDGGTRDSVIYTPNETKEASEIYFNLTEKKVIGVAPGGGPKYLNWLRPVSIDSICFLGQCQYIPVYGKDTTLIWIPHTGGDDRLVVMFGDDAVSDWSDLAMREFFKFPGAGGSLPSGFLVDVWNWGATTSAPVSCADDWVITSNGVAPDAGRGPYIENWIYPDSVPLYQNRRDPNFRSALTPAAPTYPLWYFDAAGYSSSAWDRTRAVYLPGYVTTIPTDSRSDIYAKARFDNGVWILEMKRWRKTPSGDDAQF